jgi:hypothetical protein
MVFAVQCPNAKCRKYMLVEDHQRTQVVACLLCKTPIRVGGSTPAPPRPGPPPKGSG